MNWNIFIIVVVACFALEVYCDPIDIANVKDYCIKETAIAKETVKKMEDDTLERLDEDTYCYLRCIFVSMELIDSNGELDVKKVMKEFDYFDEECLKKIPKIMECTDMAELNDCEVD